MNNCNFSQITTHTSINRMYEIRVSGQSHSLHEYHSINEYDKALYLFSLFDDQCENSDELIIEFSNKYPDFQLKCYLANKFETTADVFTLCVIFGKKNINWQIT